jgi:hypothetical protein
MLVACVCVCFNRVCLTVDLSHTHRSMLFPLNHTAGGGAGLASGVCVACVSQPLHPDVCVSIGATAGRSWGRVCVRQPLHAGPCVFRINSLCWAGLWSPMIGMVRVCVCVFVCATPKSCWLRKRCCVHVFMCASPNPALWDDMVSVFVCLCVCVCRMESRAQRGGACVWLACVAENGVLRVCVCLCLCVCVCMCMFVCQLCWLWISLSLSRVYVWCVHVVCVLCRPILGLPSGDVMVCVAASLARNQYQVLCSLVFLLCFFDVLRRQNFVNVPRSTLAGSITTLLAGDLMVCMCVFVRMHVVHVFAQSRSLWIRWCVSVCVCAQACCSCFSPNHARWGTDGVCVCVCGCVFMLVCFAQSRMHMAIDLADSSLSLSLSPK